MGDTGFTYRLLVFAMVIMVVMPMLVTIFVPTQAIDVDRDQLLESYEQMTGQQADTKVSVWVLTGIYLPYSGGSYGYTEDGWLYGSEVKTYSPSQYLDGPERLTVYKDGSGVFRYLYDTRDYDETAGTGHYGLKRYDESSGTYVDRPDGGELYTMVNFDPDHTSNIFFTESGRTDTDDGHFYYEYDGYRLAFQPISNYAIVDQDGKRIPVIATTTSLSLVWYYYYTQSGIAGQLVLSGSSGGVSYLNAAQIVSAFNTNTSTAAFDMVFNGGVDMKIYIRIDPLYLQSYTIEECYNLGYWSIMVTSESADADAYTGTDFSVNPTKLLDTVISLFTFDYAKYNMSSSMGAICSIIFVLPLYAALIVVCLDHAYLWILVGILAAVQAITSFGWW